MRLCVLVPGLLLAVACDRGDDPNPSAPAAAPAEVNLGGPARVSKPAVMPMPDSQAELDRLILAGYTPHAGHLHPPGVDQCPLAKGNEVVM